MDAITRLRVRERAGNRCEYRTLHQSDSPLASLQIEHIRAKKHGGTDDLDNLALACIDCNLHKGPNLAGIDPQTGKIAELYHPRTQNWHDHFAWEGIHLCGKTDVGRATIAVLSLNSDDQLTLRSLIRG